MSSKILYAVYEDGDDLLNAVEKVRANGMDVMDCFTPYPVHGLDKAMGIKRSRLPIAAFCFAMVGLTCAISLQYYTMGYDWPMIIGGKPYSGLPSWIPVCFELSILFAAFGMGITFFAKSRMLHGLEAELVDIKQTDDKLILAMDVTHAQDTKVLESILNDCRATEIRKPYESEVKTVTVEKVIKKTTTHSKATVAENIELTAAEKAAKIDALLNIIGIASEGANDNLKLVKGIGPVFEKNLYSIGIKTFEQISNMNLESIKLLEEVTKYFPGKIEREDWISQAKELMKK